jgi:transmembrane sensor
VPDVKIVLGGSTSIDMAPDWNEIARHVGGTASPEERSRVEDWLAEDPANARFLRLVRAGQPAAPGRTRHGRSSDRSGHRRRRPPVTTGAIALLTLLFVAIGVVVADRPWELREAAVPAVEVSWKEITVQHGEKATYVLRDNTRLTIAPGSVVRVRTDFGETNRLIELEGHALFEVTSVPNAPQLQVVAGGMVIENVGTVFDVTAYPDQDVQVVVAKGAVNIMPGTADTLYIPAGMMGTMARGTQSIRTRRANADRLLAWTRGELSFSDAPLSLVIREFERWYGVAIRLEEPSLAGMRLTASFNTGQPLPQVVEALSLSLGLDAVLQRGVVYLRQPKTHHEAEDAS